MPTASKPLRGLAWAATGISTSITCPEATPEKKQITKATCLYCKCLPSADTRSTVLLTGRYGNASRASTRSSNRNLLSLFRLFRNSDSLYANRACSHRGSSKRLKVTTYYRLQHHRSSIVLDVLLWNKFHCCSAPVMSAFSKIFHSSVVNPTIPNGNDSVESDKNALLSA